MLLSVFVAERYNSKQWIYFLMEPGPEAAAFFHAAFGHRSRAQELEACFRRRPALSLPSEGQSAKQDQSSCMFQCAGLLRQRETCKILFGWRGASLICVALLLLLPLCKRNRDGDPLCVSKVCALEHLHERNIVYRQPCLSQGTSVGFACRSCAVSGT